MKKRLQQLAIIITVALALATLFNVTCYAFTQIQDLKGLEQTLNPAGQVSTAASKELQMVGNLPNPSSWTSVIANIIKFMLQISGALAAMAFTYGGIMMVTSQGNDEKRKKGMNIILYSLLALIIMAVSYAIILGITQLRFFG